MQRYRFALRFVLASSLCLTLVPVASAESSARLAQAQNSAPAMLAPDRLANIDRYISADIDKAVVPGGILMIFKDGQRVYEKMWGERDPQTKAPMTADAIFRIYSMSKPITTVAAMMLVEEGRLALEEPVSKYIPAFKEVKVGMESKGEDGQTTFDLVPAKKPISIQDLMRHTSGITYGFFGEGGHEGAALDGKRYLSAKTLAYMTSNHIAPGSGVVPGPYYLPGAGFGFGLGFAVRTEAGVSPQNGSVGEYNWSGAGGTTFWVDPKEDLFVVFMMQSPSQRTRYRTMLHNVIYGALDRVGE